MKTLAIIASLVVLCSAQDWTCDECVEGGQALASLLSSPENIEGETQILIQEVCPQHPDPDQCTQMMPVFWGTVGPVIQGEIWLHICDDREDCAARNPMRTSVPSCEACVARVNGGADAMVWEDTVTQVVAWMSDFCGQFSTHVPGDNNDVSAGYIPSNHNNAAECVAAMEWAIPKSLAALSEYDRSWVNDFCQTWTGSC